MILLFQEVNDLKCLICKEEWKPIGDTKERQKSSIDQLTTRHFLLKHPGVVFNLMKQEKMIE